MEQGYSFNSTLKAELINMLGLSQKQIFNKKQQGVLEVSQMQDTEIEGKGAY
jgi:hypothetical protein